MKEKLEPDELVEKKEQQAIREFKELLSDLTEMLRRATGVVTVYMYWVNADREQFVKATVSTLSNNAVFQDRIAFEDHFLDDFKDIREPVQIEVGQHVDPGQLSHYYGTPPVQYITLIPFINNNQTIALTALESKHNKMGEDEESTLFFYEDALKKLLTIYLEVNNLSENQEEWQSYEQSIETILQQNRPVQVLKMLVHTIDRLLPGDGGVILVSRGMEIWCSVLNSKRAVRPPGVGTALEEQTIGYKALQSGRPEFAIHFNGNPKRLAVREPQSNGASLAVPILVHERRQALIIAYNENPLIFKESLKHKISNLCRTVSLYLTASEPRKKLENDLFTQKYSAFIPDLWEVTLQIQLERLNFSENEHSWFGFITLKDLSSLRTRYRLEDLQNLQREIVVELNPSKHGLTGFIGAKTDYVYAFFLQSNNADTIHEWNKLLSEESVSTLLLPNGKKISTSYIIGYTKVGEHHRDFHDVVKEANRALSEAFKRNGELISSS